jgi:2-hydroxy-3-keto-5-methylthiopentenyl-1-phosphate phosphatase
MRWTPVLAISNRTDAFVSGMTPIIRAVLSKLVGEHAADDIEIISNEVHFLSEDRDSKWEIQYRHPTSSFGHDKSRAILPYRELPNPPTLFFFGDGVSDMSAAAHADCLFVKQKEDGENDLHVYCDRQGIKHILFKTFADALPVVQSVVEGKKSVQEVLEKGVAP